MTTNANIKKAAEQLAPLYGKPYGVMTASGMAAAELALELCGVDRGDEVVVPCETCFRVPAAVLRRGATPVFAATTSHLLEPKQLKLAIGPRTRAVVAVHHFGLPCHMHELRKEIPNTVALIEDAAQAFDLRIDGSRVGKWSDYVISSFSSSKPVALGGGGGVFGASSDLTEALDGYGDSPRLAKEPPRSYTLHPAAIERLDAAISEAKRKIDTRRNLARRIQPILERVGLHPWIGREGDAPCWHRLPFRTKDTASRQTVLSAHEANCAIELPHKTALPDLPMFRNARGVRKVDTADDLYLRLDNEDCVDVWVHALEQAFADNTA